MCLVIVHKDTHSGDRCTPCKSIGTHLKSAPPEVHPLHNHSGEVQEKALLALERERSLCHFLEGKLQVFLLVSPVRALLGSLLVPKWVLECHPTALLV